MVTKILIGIIIGVIAGVCGSLIEKSYKVAGRNTDEWLVPLIMLLDILAGGVFVLDSLSYGLWYALLAAAEIFVTAVVIMHLIDSIQDDKSNVK